MHEGQHPHGLGGVGGIFSPEPQRPIVVVDLPEVPLALELDRTEVALPVGVVVLGEGVERRDVAAQSVQIVSSGRAATIRVSIIFVDPGSIALRALSFSSAIFSFVGCIGSSLSCSGFVKCRSLAPSWRPVLRGANNAGVGSENLRIPKKASRQSASGSRHPRRGALYMPG